MNDTDLAEHISWDLEPLLEGGTLDALLERADSLVAGLQRHRGRVGQLDSGELGALMRDVEAVLDATERAGNFAQLDYTTATGDAAKGALMARVEERSTAIATRLLFVDLEWAAVDDERADALLADPQLSFCAHHLRTMRRYRPHLLSEPEEKLLTEKGVTGVSAWNRLFDDLLSATTVKLAESDEPVSFELALARLQHPDRAVRQDAAAAFTKALEPGLRTRAFIYNTLLNDKAVDDRLRRYPSWGTSRNLANQASDASVRALVEAVAARNDIPQRWYRLKARVLGLDRLADYDRAASIVAPGASDRAVGWEEAKTLVLDAYGSFSPELAAGAKRFFDESWIDAPLRPGKRGGAFCSPAVPSLHPYVLLNYTGTRRDVLVMAHELGHGVHFLLGREQSIFHHMVPLTVAETASVFGETVTFNRLLEAESDPHGRFGLLAEDVEGAIATIFRQVAMYRFEESAHTARRTEGELAVDRLNELWAASQVDLFGDSVEVTPDYRSWWSYIPHFIHTPGYVYAYAFGQLLAMSVFRRYLDAGPEFVPRYMDMLRAGGSDSPEGLAERVGCDLTDPGFWDAGLDLVAERLQLAEEAAVAAGRIAAQPA